MLGKQEGKNVGDGKHAAAVSIELLRLQSVIPGNSIKQLDVVVFRARKSARGLSLSSFKLPLCSHFLLQGLLIHRSTLALAAYNSSFMFFVSATW